MSEDDQADGVKAFTPLPAVTDAVRTLASALNRAGAATGGDPLLDCDEREFMDRWKELRQHAGVGEPLIVHFAGHGTQPDDGGALYLATAGGEARDDLLEDTCVSFDRLLRTAENGSRPVLFVLDVCEAGQAIVQQQLVELASRRRQDAVRNVWIIGACTNNAITYGARFTTASAEALHQLVDGNLDITPTLEYVPVGTLATAIDRELARADHAVGRPAQAVVHSPHIQAAPESQPFFRNPAHTNEPGARLLTGMNPLLREFALGCAPGLDPLHFATRAAGNPTASTIHFSGRLSQLQRMQGWINNADGAQGRLLVVTGGPGSGKSALLGVTVCLVHPELEPLGVLVGPAVEHFEPRMPSIVLAVHARQLTLQQITDSLCHQLHSQTAGRTSPNDSSNTESPESPDLGSTRALLHELRNTYDVLVILDALDEAADPAAVVEELLLPLAGASDSGPATHCRIVFGTRPWWDTLPALKQYLIDRPGAALDLDPATDDDRRVLANDLATYLIKLLPRRRYPRSEIKRIADRLAAYSDSGAFLVAALYADHLLAGDQPISGDPPCTITEVFDLHTGALAATDPWILPVLTALGQARGQGMPLDLIHAAALADQPPAPQQSTPQLSDTRRALTKAAFYLRTTPDTDQRLLYRYFHQALTDRTKPHGDPTAIHNALINTISVGSSPDWARAQPYLLRHAADHAAAADSGSLDSLLEDPQFLVHAEPDTLSPHLHHAGTEHGLLRAHIYRTTTTHHSRRNYPDVRRDLLALDAASWQQPDLALAIANVPLYGRPGDAVPIWATSQAHPARRHTLKVSTNRATPLATATRPDGAPLAITVSAEGTAIVWDLTTGSRLHVLTLPTRPVKTVATAMGPDGAPIAITTSQDGTATVWDLTTGTQLHTLTSHTDTTKGIITATLPDGTPIAITTNHRGTATVWDLTTGAQLQELTGHTSLATPIATAARPDRSPIAITTSAEGTAIVWDLATGTQLHKLTGHTGPVIAVATAALPDGTPLAITTSDDHTAIVWNLTTGTQLHELSMPTRWVKTVATAAQPDGTPIAITTSYDGTPTVWDLATGAKLHELTGHISLATPIATAARPDRTLIALTTSADHTVVMWDLATGTRLDTLSGHGGPVNAVATTALPDGTPLAITTSDDHTAIVWNLTASTAVRTLSGHEGLVQSVVTATRPDGAHLAMTASHDRTVTVRDLATGTRRDTLPNPSGLNALATTARADGTPLAITTGVRHTVIVWDLTVGTQLHVLTGHTGPVNAVATAALCDRTPVAITTGADRTAIVWDLATGSQLHVLTGHTGPVNAVATAALPDGTPLAITTSTDRSAIVWDLARGTQLHSLDGHSIMVFTIATAALPDGTPLAITTSDDHTAIVWNLATGTQLHELTGHTGPVNAVATAALCDGTPLAITTSDDHTAIVWNLATGTQLHELTGHTGPVNAVATATRPDGTPVAITTSHDLTITAWNLITGQSVWCSQLPYRGRRIACTDVGFLVAYAQDVVYFVWNPKVFTDGRVARHQQGKPHQGCGPSTHARREGCAAAT